jgi:hypothetical protein
VLSAGSLTVALLIAGLAAVVGFGAGGRAAAATAAIGALVAVELGGLIVSALDWPLRLVVIPGGVATLATQATPDGRRAHRFAASWVMLHLPPRRQSLNRGLARRPEEPEEIGGALWVGSDERTRSLPRGRVKGPASVSFAAPVEARRSRRRVSVRRLGLRARRGAIVRSVTLRAGETLEVRP